MSKSLPIERDTAGNAVFRPFCRPGEELNDLLATDALRIGELKTSYLSATVKDALTPNTPNSQRLVITTANADYLPEINLGEQMITFREDGRLGAEDWTQWPQWYFDGQEYFAYIPRKPSGPDLDRHPLKILWWQMKETHFITVTETSGVLDPNIAQQLYDVRSKLMEEINTCSTPNANDWLLLQENARNMRSLTSSLLFTPQEYYSVVLTVAAAQRACFSTRAILDKIKKWDPMSLTTSSPVDNRLIGCVTDRLSVVHDMFERGVPVWYVRPINYLPHNINIVSPEPVVQPKNAGINITPWKNAPVFYHGALSPKIHTAINRWKPGTLDIRFLPGASEDNVGKLELNNRPAPYMMSKALEQVEKKKSKSTLAINKILFTDLGGPTATKALNSWRCALEAVVVDVERVIDHPNQRIFRGYAFPPPHILCSPDGQNNSELMLAWIVIRSSWLTRFSAEAASVLPNPQQWRSYLRDIALELELLRKDTRKKNMIAASSSSSTSNNTPGSKGQNRKNNNAARNRKAKDASRAMFTIEVPSPDKVTLLTWCKQTVWERNRVVEFPLLCQKMVVWDVQEHNFRLELMTLDRTMLADLWGSPQTKAARMDKLAAIWPNDFILMKELPTRASGLAAQDLSLRRFFLRAFQDVLADWPGETPKRLSSFILRDFVNERMRWHEAALSEFEVVASKFYCQTFFDYFGRAPCVPPEFPVITST